MTEGDLALRLPLEGQTSYSFFLSLFPLFTVMKASLFSCVAAAALFISTAASAAPLGDHDRDLRRMSPRERARYEQAQRDRARFEQAQRARERQQAQERARWEAQHRHDRGPARPYGR